LEALRFNSNGAEPGGATGTATAGDIAPGTTGIINCNLPANWQQYDVLYLTAYDPHQKEIYTWSWPIAKPDAIASRIVKTDGNATVSFTEKDSLITATAGDVSISLNARTGLLQQVQNAKGIIPLTNGPVLCEGDAGFIKWNP